MNNNVYWFLTFVLSLCGATTAFHALFNKRDSRAAAMWIIVSLLIPLIGSVAYCLFGINRIQRRARKLRKNKTHSLHKNHLEQDQQLNGGEYTRFSELIRTTTAMTQSPLLPGNSVTALHNGENAYPVMLDAIANATQHVYLSMYIFQNDACGEKFMNALIKTHQRGITVRVLLDGYGQWPVTFSMANRLRKAGVPVGLFNPIKLFPPNIHINLRNHRKLLIVDNTVAFAGGMNIAKQHCAIDDQSSAHIIDLSFRFTGPILQQLYNVFLDEWEFVTGENLIVPKNSPVTSSKPSSLSTEQGSLCRVIVDGPDDDQDGITAVLLGAIGAANRRLAIISPYFLPPREIVGALQTAARRGVQVDILLPRRSDRRFVDWATRNMLWELLNDGVNVYYQLTSFPHTKLFIVDDFYMHTGSANMDMRSLRLNFELVVEIYDHAFGAQMIEHFDECLKKAETISLERLHARPLWQRFRDAFCWLFSPLL
ncbi:MAG: cardiolipin synthase [Gammaproteobacteria bacterium]|nr:cardiolipin synthase [Gammaproteobacteria bacterium]